MKNNKILTCKILRVTAICPSFLNDPDSEFYQYSFIVKEFENGLILVPGDTTNDWFFENRSLIQANGGDILVSIEDIGEEELSTASLLESIQGSIKEFGINSVPVKHLELWR